MKQNKKAIWNLKQIEKGFEKFFKENGRLPTAPEIDKLTYLPTSRTMQRRFGGLQKIREKMGYADSEFGINFGGGKFRKQTVVKLNLDALDAEKRIESKLIKIFGEVFIHTEKRFGNMKNRVDFFIYSKDLHFGIELINPSTFRNLQKNINLKIDRYKNFPASLIFLIAHNKFSQKRIDSWCLNKRKSLPKNSKIMSLSRFLEWIKHLKPYPNPI